MASTERGLGLVRLRTDGEVVGSGLESRVVSVPQEPTLGVGGANGMSRAKPTKDGAIWKCLNRSAGVGCLCFGRALGRQAVEAGRSVGVPSWGLDEVDKSSSVVVVRELLLLTEGPRTGEMFLSPGSRQGSEGPGHPCRRVPRVRCPAIPGGNAQPGWVVCVFLPWFWMVGES